MPSIIPSYIYTIFASLIVGTLIIGMCALATSNIRQEAEKQQLSNIEEYVAAKSLELASNALANNLTSTVSLDLPNLIGNKIYWIRIANDSSKTWVEAGFGKIVVRSEQKTEIPLEAFASGTHISSSRSASLHCYTDNQSIHLEIQGDN
jgi:hypothetical protein